MSIGTVMMKNDDQSDASSFMVRAQDDNMSDGTFLGKAQINGNQTIIGRDSDFQDQGNSTFIGKPQGNQTFIGRES